MTRLVDRFGRTGFAALTSLIWALPLAAWAGSADLSPIDRTAYPWIALAASAGSADLSPIDRTAYPWIALAIGLVMLAVWIVLLTRLGAVPVQPRQRRFDVRQMSRSEKRWTLALIAFGTGLIAWLNGAATVDWTPLSAAIGAGKVGPSLLALALAVFLVAMLAGIWLSWGRTSAAFKQRVGRASSLSM